MALTVLNQKIPEYIKKYKYVIVILGVGILLMLLPTGSKTEESTQTPSQQEEFQDDTDQKLEQILSRINGAGRVEVMLTLVAEKETEYQIDEDRSTSDSSDSVHSTTVIVTDASRNERGLVRRIKAPVYRGAIVICDGADNPSVCLSITDAVSKVTGLSLNHISVLKME